MELIIQEDIPSFVTKIYGKIEKGNQTYIVGYDGKNLVEQLLPDSPFVDNKKIKPLLVIPHHFLRDLVAGFAEYAQKKDIRTENQNLLEGKLIATEKHLSDMQDFAKKLLDSQIKLK